MGKPRRTTRVGPRGQHMCSRAAGPSIKVSAGWVHLPHVGRHFLPDTHPGPRCETSPHLKMVYPQRVWLSCTTRRKDNPALHRSNSSRSTHLTTYVRRSAVSRSAVSSQQSAVSRSAHHVGVPFRLGGVPSAVGTRGLVSRRTRDPRPA